MTFNSFDLIGCEESINIWFSRMFSTCRKCGCLLHDSNCYQRDDTRSHLHTYCKVCYIDLQKVRNSKIVKVTKPYYYLINPKRIVFFDSQEEKEKYLADRKSLSKFSKICDDYSSVVGCPEYEGTNRLLCDQCGGMLLRNDHGELECQICHLISEYPFSEIERNISFDKQPYERFNHRDGHWSTNQYWINELDDSSNNEGCFDFYYSRAYTKYNKISRKD